MSGEAPAGSLCRQEAEVVYRVRATELILQDGPTLTNSSLCTLYAH